MLVHTPLALVVVQRSYVVPVVPHEEAAVQVVPPEPVAQWAERSCAASVQSVHEAQV